MTKSNISRFLFLYSCVLENLTSWNDDAESDTLLENGLRDLLDGDCMEYCRLKILSDLNDRLKCAELQSGRGELDLSRSDDLFTSVRGRRFGWAPGQIRLEKKANLDLLASDYLVPHRGRREMTRKHFLRVDRNPFRGQHDEPNRFMPNRGKRPRVIIPKSQTSYERYPSDPWLFQNINSDDRNMIDRLKDLSQLGMEVRQDTEKRASREPLLGS